VIKAKQNINNVSPDFVRLSGAGTRWVGSRSGCHNRASNIANNTILLVKPVSAPIVEKKVWPNAQKTNKLMHTVRQVVSQSHHAAGRPSRRFRFPQPPRTKLEVRPQPINVVIKS
jgi:hypothetical protein